MHLLVPSSLTSLVALKDHTTLRVGGLAEHFARPQDRASLLETIDECRRVGMPFRLLGRGSNVFVGDDGVPGMVIRNTDACRGIEVKGRYVKVGASEPLQRLINEAAKHNLGGIEYLYSVPGNVGGAVYMNAGRGKAYRQSIANVVVSVEAYHRGRLVTFSYRQCRFSYRYSAFHELEDAVILSATLKLVSCPGDMVRKKVTERMGFVRETQDTGFPNAGTVFKSGFALGAELKGKAKGSASFSEKTSNWIIHDGHASSTDIWRLLELAYREHERKRLPIPVLEWIVW